MINSGAIVVGSLIRNDLKLADKFDYVSYASPSYLLLYFTLSKSIISFHSKTQLYAAVPPGFRFEDGNFNGSAS